MLQGADTVCIYTSISLEADDEGETPLVASGKGESFLETGGENETSQEASGEGETPLATGDTGKTSPEAEQGAGVQRLYETGDKAARLAE